MAGPLAAAIPASALAAIATPILSFRSEQVMRIATSMDASRCQRDDGQRDDGQRNSQGLAAARRRLGHNGRDLHELISRFTPTWDILNPRSAAAQGSND